MKKTFDVYRSSDGTFENNKWLGTINCANSDEAFEILKTDIMPQYYNTSLTTYKLIERK